MDIYAYAESIDYAADYYDHHTGYIFTTFRNMVV